MSKKLPRLTASQVIKLLNKLGFEESRSSGSHRIYKNREKSKRIVVPYHSNKIIHPKIIKDILKITGVTLEDFIKLQ